MTPISGPHDAAMNDSLEDAVTSVADRAAGIADAASKRASDMADATTRNVKNFANQAKEKLGQTTDYFKNTDMQGMKDDVTQFAKANPTYALLGAAAIGFLVGRLMSRD
jgi:ElaB/YqjD/DUF883 family membrane-anchored ribosome-binding protein